MIITRTPFRISLFGGGTDYPGWYSENGGAVLATTIDKYCYISCRYLPPFFEHRLRLVYSRVEMCRQIEEIQHPAVRAVLQMMDFRRGLEIHHDGDLPARSGMGSSSAFTVGFLHAMYGLMGSISSREKLATEAIHVERDLLQEVVGSQDQILAAFGGFNRVEFHRDHTFRVEPVLVPKARLQELNGSLMLFYTGLKRTASNIAASYAGDMKARSTQLTSMRSMVDEALSILQSREPLDRLGELMHHAWQMKRSLSGLVSSPEVDQIYELARGGGARGGKLLGAGAGGFMLLFVPPQDRQRVLERMRAFVWVPFEFEANGSQIVFYSPEPDYAALDSAGAPVLAFREAIATAGGRRKDSDS